MQHAYGLAERAAAEGEVPVGAVLVSDENQMMGEGYNQPISGCDPTAHAEVLALRQGAKKISNYRLMHSTLYVTLEPCVMCVGAIVHARVKRLVFGAQDPRAGAINSAFDIIESGKLNHKVQCEGGLLDIRCGEILKNFFKSRR